MLDNHVKHSSIVEELRCGKTVTYFTLGVSMQPLLRERETHVMIAPVGKVKKGDILLYVRKNGDFVLHRLICEDSHYYYMRGDNTYGLERIKKEQAAGVVTHIYRKGRTFSVTDKKYRLYVMLWKVIYPLRFCVWKIKHRLG